MENGLPTESLIRKYRLLRGMLAIIIVGFALANCICFFYMRAAQATNRRMLENMLASIEHLAQLAHDVDKRRLLVDTLIFQSTQDEWEGVQQRIAAVDADFAANAAAYEPLANLPGELQLWESLKAQLAALRPPVAHVMALSQRNQDGQAQAEMLVLKGQFEGVSRTAESLIKLNHDEAEREVIRVREYQLRSLYVLLGTTLWGVLFAALLAAWLTRAMRQQDELTRQATVRLEQRNRELDAFAGRVAHDLRGPLTTISLSAARLSEQAPEERGTTSILRRGVEQMERLIHDLLLLSRVTGQMTDVAADTATVAAGVEEDLRPQIASVGGTLSVDAEPAQVRCSPGLLRQVLWNLGENAIKYRRPAVPLELAIRGRVHRGQYELRVTDNGLGMSAEEIRHAFEPFFRSEKVRGIQGTGLGLSIVRRVVESSGGSVSLASLPDHGTSITINLQRTKT